MLQLFIILAQNTAASCCLLLSFNDVSLPASTFVSQWQHSQTIVSQIFCFGDFLKPLFWWKVRFYRLWEKQWEISTFVVLAKVNCSWGVEKNPHVSCWWLFNILCWPSKTSVCWYHTSVTETLYWAGLRDLSLGKITAWWQTSESLKQRWKTTGSRELEKEARTWQDAKAIAQAVVATQAEQCQLWQSCKIL